jgi:ketosteroid isomerase-like protein
MSQKNVELVQGVFDAVARGDTEAVLAVYDPDVEYDFTQSAVGLGLTRNVYRGHDGIREWTRDRFDAMEESEDLCQQLIDAGPHVISSVISRGRGRSSADAASAAGV